MQLELIAADSGSSHPQGSAARGERVYNVGEIARLDVEASVAISDDGNAIVTFTETPVSAGAAYANSVCRLGISGTNWDTEFSTIPKCGMGFPHFLRLFPERFLLSVSAHILG